MAAPAPNATSASDTVVELTGVWKLYRQKQRSERWQDVFGRMFHPKVKVVEALRGIDLRIARGEVVAYAGPNGAGKSTTIKLLSSLLAPDRGTVRALGLNPIANRVAYVRRIGVVFGQRTELWWDHPVAASYEWKRVVWDVPPERYARMLALVKELLGLDEFFHSLVRELSLGQRMRADLGMALLHEPELLFLDEPTLGLDVLAKRQMLAFIKDLNRRQQVTVLVTSHDMSDLEQLAGRIVMIHRGNIAYDGDFDRLRRTFGDRRRLLIETDAIAAPALAGARLLESVGTRHEYVFDAQQVAMTALLGQATAQVPILDLETHKAPIDDVIADIYAAWQGEGEAPG
jgi:ABC-2 type transport system ATP-binding protein